MSRFPFLGVSALAEAAAACVVGRVRRGRDARAALLVVALGLASAGVAPRAAGAVPRYLSSFGQAQVPTPKTFGWITGIAVDSSTGDVFVPSENPIRRFDTNGNFILQFGSCPSCRGMDVEAVSHDLYAADGGHNRVLQYTRTGQLVRQWGSSGTGNGQFLSLFDVSVDTAGGQLFTIDGSRIQVFDLQGNFLRAWGSVGQGWGQFSGNASGQPYGVSFDPVTRTVWASDAYHDRIYAFDEFGTLLGGWDDNGGGSGPGEMRWARNLDVDAAGRVYECDADNERIQVFDPSGSFLQEFRGPHDVENGAFHPRGIAVNRTTGEKWVAAAYAQRVDKFDASNHYLFSIGDRQRHGPILWNPFAIAVSPTSGDVFVDDAGHFMMKRFSRAGAFLSEWGGSARLDPYNDGRFGFEAKTLLDRAQTPIAVDLEGDLWAAGYGTHYLGDPHFYRVRRFDPLGTFLSGWLPDRRPDQAYSELALGVGIDPLAGRVYVSDAQADVVRVHAANGTVIQTIPVPEPSGIAPTADGFYVVAAGTDSVRRYDRSGTLLREWGGPGVANGKFDFPTTGVGSGIALDSTGKVYVADTLHNRVQVFDGDGNFLEAFGTEGTGAGQFRAPYGLAIGQATDTLYVLDTGNNRVEAFALGTSPECFDGVDDDGDGYVDYPADPGCRFADSRLEKTQCQDGIDNDFATGIDFDGGASLNGGVPFSTPDPQCLGAPSGTRESGTHACGLGFEVTLALLPLVWARRRRARSRDSVRP